MPEPIAENCWQKNPPEEPGAYWWRAKEGDEAFVRNLIRWSCGGLLVDRAFSYQPSEPRNIGGEWLPVPSPERLMELLRIKNTFHDEIAKALRCLGHNDNGFQDGVDILLRLIGRPTLNEAIGPSKTLTIYELLRQGGMTDAR